MKFTIFILFILLLLASCKKDSPVEIENPEGESATLLWQSPTSDGPLVSGRFYQRIVDNKLLVLGNLNGKSSIIAKNPANGENIWTWSDLFEGDDQVWNENAYISNNNFVYKFWDKIYNVNLSDGTTNWRELKLEDFTTHIVDGISQDMFIPSLASNINGDSIYNKLLKVDVATGNTSDFQTPKYTQTHLSGRSEIGGIRRIKAFNIDGQDKILLGLIECDSTWKCYTYLSLYDIESASWDYELSEIGLGRTSTTINGESIIVGDFVYHTSGIYATCHDLRTGELIWRKELNAGASAGGFIVSEEDNIMVVSTHSVDRTTFGLSLTTGNIQWTTETTGNNGQPYALNGVVYFTSNGDGKLHALDIATGEYIWKIDSPDSDSNNSFRGELTGIPGENGEKGRIFTSSYLNAFCFEAAR